MVAVAVLDTEVQSARPGAVAPPHLLCEVLGVRDGGGRTTF